MIRVFSGAVLATLALTAQAFDNEWHGLLDARLVHSDSARDWLHGGLDKQRFDRDHDGLQLGQAVLQGRIGLTDTVSAHAWVNAYDERRYGVGLGEAYLRWRPIPSSAWRWHVKGGLFFPELSLENTGLGWTSDYLISSSAINTWVGEELRAKGLEFGGHFDGARVGSAHDWRANAGIYRWNDPAGGLLTWRGWTVGDRVTASAERVPFPELPIFTATGYWAGQIPGIEPFREVDRKTGYYANLGYQYLDRAGLTLMHYDNHGNPKALKGGQWAWDTRFNHVGTYWRQGGTTLLAQAMDGQTIMGFAPFHDVTVDFRAWYVLLSQQLGAHRVSLRYDWFELDDRDGHEDDPNEEYGEALAVGWCWSFRRNMDLSGEWLRQDSDRYAREELLGLAADRREDLWQALLRWQF